MSRSLPMDAIVRLRRFPLPTYSRRKYLNYRLSLHLAIIWAYDFRGMVSYPDWPRTLVAFSFPRWLDCPVPAFANYLMSLPISLLAFINPGYAGRSYLYDASRYLHDGNIYIWVDNIDLELVSTQFCRDSARQRARRQTRQRLKERAKKRARVRITLRTKPLFRGKFKIVGGVVVPLWVYNQLPFSR